LIGTNNISHPIWDDGSGNGCTQDVAGKKHGFVRYEHF